MSDQNTEQEPSMEEILASIRRIISEDGDEENAAPAAEAAEAAPEPVAEEGPAEEPEPEPEPAAEEDVLELTDEVQDDGTVVNLNTGEPAAEAELEAEETPEEFVETLEAEEEVELEMVDAEEEPAPAEPAIEETPEPVPEPAEELAAEAAERLVSDDPAMTSVSSLSALAAAVDTHRRAVDPSIGPRTIEDLVKEVMRPMIKEWLDDNLPSLVERMVGREIERLTREAEDISQR